MVDISERKPSERTIDIIDPATFEALGITVSIMALDDPRMKRIKRTLTDRRNSAAMKGKLTKAEEMEEEGNNLLFAAMTGWKWGKDSNGEQNTFHGEVPDFNPKNVKEVFEELPWFKRQVDEAVGDDRSFFNMSKPS